MTNTGNTFHPTRFEDIAVTVDFHCNSACRFCIVQEGMNRYDGVPFERFEAMVQDNLRSKRYHRVLFTGGEVTLEKSLPKFLRLARSSGAFTHLRLQTHGRRLADPAFARSLIEDGVDEFFVSIHGSDAASHEDITQRKGSFAEVLACLENLAKHPVKVLTNTVLTRRNIASIPALVDVVADRGVRHMEFWNYLPMEDFDDERDLITPMEELLPPLHKALDRCVERGVHRVVKYVPFCLLGSHAQALDNSQPDVLIVEQFWNTFPRFDCLYEAQCEHSEHCLGVQHAYVHKFGWEENRLKPIARIRPWKPRETPPEASTDRTQDTHASDHAHPPWEALVQGATEGTNAQLQRVQLTRNQARYRYTWEQCAVTVVLAARDEQNKAFDRSRSFNVFYTEASGIEQERDRKTLETLLRSIVRCLQQRDDGSLQLDARKGLLQVLR